MNAVSSHGKQISWPTIAMFALGFWLSASLLLDLVIIPTLFAAGMMATAGFASAGYMMFGIFNHVELLCAAVVLTSFLVIYRHHTYLSPNKARWSVILSVALFLITITCTYFLTPYMSALGVQLNLFEAVRQMPPAMVSLHEGYWALEVLKLVAGGLLLRWCYRDTCTI